MKLTKVGLVCGVAAVALAMTSMAYGFCSPSDFNPTWESANPGTCRDKTIPTGALLGNGSLGVVNGGDGNHKEFVAAEGERRYSLVVKDDGLYYVGPGLIISVF